MVQINSVCRSIPLLKLPSLKLFLCVTMNAPTNIVEFTQWRYINSKQVCNLHSPTLLTYRIFVRRSGGRTQDGGCVIDVPGTITRNRDAITTEYKVPHAYIELIGSTFDHEPPWHNKSCTL